MSSLPTCDEYSLHRILFYLGGAEIIRLVLCGAQNLSHKVFACPSLSFTWCGPGRSRWPSLISSFTRLEHLKYANAEDVEALPCEGLEIAHLPRSLKSLELRFYDPISPLLSATVTPDSRLSYSSLALTTQLPLLETLVIRTSLELAAGALACFASIPLTRLDLNSPSITWNPSYWPSTLKSLSLSQVEACEDPKQWLFPPHLESLFLSFNMQNPIWIKNLPSTLTDLQMHYWADDANHTEYWRHLPSGLKNLAALVYGSSLSLNNFTHLPKTLEKLDLLGRMEKPQIYGNKTLDEVDPFWKPHDELLDSMLEACPRTLTELDIRDCFYSVAHLSKLPRGMKGLIVRRSAPLPFPSSTCLFPHLTQLDLSHGSSSTSLTGNLPTSITHLRLRELTDEFRLSLPLLRKLSCESGSLSEYGTSCLPRSIEYLEISDRMFQTKECVAQLPPNLSTLFIVEDPEGSGSDLTAPPIPIGNPATSLLLPKSLTQLNFYRLPWLNQEWIDGLSSLPQLTSLVIFSANSGFSESVLNHLPRRLTKLTISITKLSVEGLKALPPTLVDIDMVLLKDDDTTQLNDEDMIHVPRGAYTLSISPSPLLTEKCVSLLPPDLYWLYFGFRRPLWFNDTFDPLRGYRR